MRRVPEHAPIVTAAAMRAAEAAAFASGQSQREVMERAGAAVAVQVARLAAGRAILVLAGPGNNGGDAYVVARWLAERGHDVTVAGLGAPTGVAAEMRAAWTGEVTDLDTVAPRVVLVDGLFGTGVSRPLAADVARALARLRRGAAITIAIDLPSGIATDDGSDLEAAGADVTVALAALKPGHVLGDGAGASGHVLLADIGVPVASHWHTLARPSLEPPPRDAHKFTRGMVAVLGGAMPGASRLAARAAMAAGAGYVVLAGEDRGGPDALVHRTTDADLFGDPRIGALVCGPGLGRDAAASDLLDRALACERPLVLDGDALSLLGADAATRLRGKHAILTPHSGEFDRMFGVGQGSKIDRTIAAAARIGCTIVHKGADTVIADPAGRVTVSAAAPTWLASAGTGDVLAGLVAARCAAGAADPASEAVWLHARAAALAGAGLIADGLIDHIGGAIEECL
ncbi:NAD(P)H-hydrate dehydratase [Sphingomonas donggukensis]|uniref:Bifunctional NAD(P)H-hydrate repair enzyme n=1 Tax=Sphingomonas donggukensis TaxID=2949093 RepID=A0ABY4TVP0_9SPHN|nr:NAD(P)H-hydrate dehydratase [Sphingomonas donggukensis]URW76470.1 NAD(P)H-hydrate dehydratase [Sphingomonas donggukensis]